MKPPFQRIIVIGCPGAGKSTFSRALSRLTRLPLHHLDLIWHRPDRTNLTKADFDRRLADLLTGEEWIIDGNYQRTLEPRLERCDAVFLLDLPLEVCLEGVASRIGRPRPDMPWVETEFDPEFRQWIMDFPNRELPLIYEKLSRHPDKTVMILRSRAEMETCLAQLEQQLSGK